MGATCGASSPRLRSPTSASSSSTESTVRRTLTSLGHGGTRSCVRRKTARSRRTCLATCSPSTATSLKSAGLLSAGTSSTTLLLRTTSECAGQQHRLAQGNLLWLVGSSAMPHCLRLDNRHFGYLICCVSQCGTEVAQGRVGGWHV